VRRCQPSTSISYATVIGVSLMLRMSPQNEYFTAQTVANLHVRILARTTFPGICLDIGNAASGPQPGPSNKARVDTVTRA
jgi:hypothetical protein